MFYVYILRSRKDNKYYTGSTKNIQKRVREHNSGKVKSTKSRQPFDLLYFEKFKMLKEARIRELFFKTPKGTRERSKILDRGVEQPGSSSGS